MKAPNIIYLHGYPDKPFLCQDWGVAPTMRVVRGQQAENVAYIRKDALLEWAKDMKEANDGVCDTSYYQEFIDKINSM